MTAPRGSATVALLKVSPSPNWIGCPKSGAIGPPDFLAPNAIGRYCAEYWPGDAVRRYVPAGSPVNSNAPWASVVAVRERMPLNCAPTLTLVCAPLITMVWIVTPVDPGAGSGMGGVIAMTWTLARRTGLPVSAATPRPRMTAVPAGSGGGGRRTGSRGWPIWGAGAAGGGGGGGWAPAGTPALDRRRMLRTPARMANGTRT